MPFFAVMGASGRTGAGCVDELLKQGHRVRAVVRSEASAEKLKAKGAETSIADVLDVDALKAAFTGVDGAYLMYPSGHTQIDILAHGQAAAAAAVAAAEAAKVPFVVILSSIGAQHPSGTGPIVNTHVFEQLLKKSSLSYTVVRGPGFLDNWGSVIGAAVAQGVFPTMYQDATLKFPQAFSYDIGVIAAQALIDGPRPPAKGQPRIIEVHGPAEYSVTDVANALGEVLGKPIHVVVVPPAQHVPFFQSVGMSEKTAPVMAELFAGLTTGLLTFEGHEVQRGTTTAVAALRQLLAAPATH